jgi:hypothetical protein
MNTMSDTICPHCGSRNPKSAYCCLNCFKVVSAAPKSIWRKDVKPSVATLVIVTALIAAGVFYAKKRKEVYDVEMDIQAQTAKYVRSMTDIRVTKRIDSKRSTILESAEKIANQ